MRLTTVAAIGVLLFDGRDSASATRRQWAARSKGAALQPKDNRRQSWTIGIGDGGSVLAQHPTTGCVLSVHAPTYTIRHASAHWMASSPVHSAKGHIDAVHRVSQSSHNGGLASPTGRFQPPHRSLCERILAQRHRPARRKPHRALTCLRPQQRRAAARRLRRWRRGCQRFRGTRLQGIAVRG